MTPSADGQSLYYENRDGEALYRAAKNGSGEELIYRTPPERVLMRSLPYPDGKSILLVLPTKGTSDTFAFERLDLGKRRVEELGG